VEHEQRDSTTWLVKTKSAGMAGRVTVLVQKDNLGRQLVDKVCT